MADWRTYTWVLPIVGALFAIIAIATPVMADANITVEWWNDWEEEWVNGVPITMPLDIWMIGFYDSGPYGDGWVDDLSETFGGLFEMELAPFIIGFLGVIIGAIAGIGVGILGYRGDFRKNIAALSGILMIGFTLIFIIWVEAEWAPLSGETVTFVEEWNGTDEFRFTYQLDLGFGIIGPFIGGVFCLAGVLIPPEERAMSSASKQPGVTPASNLKFCSDCGAEATGKFCSSCGKPIVR